MDEEKADNYEMDLRKAVELQSDNISSDPKPDQIAKKDPQESGNSEGLMATEIRHLALRQR